MSYFFGGILIVLSLIAFANGYMINEQAKTIMQQIYGGIFYAMATILFTGAMILFGTAMALEAVLLKVKMKEPLSHPFKSESDSLFKTEAEIEQEVARLTREEEAETKKLPKQYQHKGCKDCSADVTECAYCCHSSGNFKLPDMNTSHKK